MKYSQSSSRPIVVTERLSPDAWKHFYDSDAWKRFYENRDWPFPPQPPSLGPDDHALDRLEKQMRELQQRLEQLEKRQKGMPSRFPEKPDAQGSQKQDEPSAPENTEFEQI